MKAKLTTALVAALLAGSVGVAFAQSGTTSSMKSSTASPAKSGTTASSTDSSKLTGCNTLASKEEKGKQGSVPNSSSHNAATTGSSVPNKPPKGC